MPRRNLGELLSQRPVDPYQGPPQRPAAPRGEDRSLRARSPMARRLGDLIEMGVDVFAGALGLPVPNDQAAALGELLSMAAPMVAAPKAAMRAILPMRVKDPIKGYHGSPYDFDRFDMSKIGTGEGAQAYGHGLYFADSEGVAKSYRDNLSHGNTENLIQSLLDRMKGISYTPEQAAEAITRIGGTFDASSAELARRIAADPASVASIAKLTPSWSGSRSPYYSSAEIATLGQLSERAKNITPGRMYEVNIHADPTDLLDWDAPLSRQSERVQAAAAAPKQRVRLEDLSREDLIDRLRTVDSNGVWTDADNIAEFGRPATREELLESARSMDLEDYLNQAIGQDAPDVTGRSLYHQLATREGGGGMSSARGQAAASEQLKAAGIPGIKYLDGSSRPHMEDVMRGIQRSTEKVDRLAAEYRTAPSESLASRLSDARQELESAKRGAADLTRNYVVFDDRLIEIVKKYGIAGAVGAGLLTQAEADGIANGSLEVRVQ
jgi:hypothetical protein